MMKTNKTTNSKMPFIQVPKVLWENERYRYLSVAAILLYALLLDRYKLAARTCNARRNERGQVYICYSVAEAEKYVRCGHDKACYLFRELQNVGLIERKRKGLGKESQIVVFLPVANGEEQGLLNSEFQDLQRADYRVSRIDRAVDNNTNISLLIDNTLDANQLLSGDGYPDSMGAHISPKWDNATAYDAFFSSYPEERRGNYKQGLTAYCNIVTTPAAASEALENLSAWISSPSWKQNRGQYIPFLTNYLMRGYAFSKPFTTKDVLCNSGELGDAELEAIKKLMQG